MASKNNYLIAPFQIIINKENLPLNSIHSTGEISSSGIENFISQINNINTFCINNNIKIDQIYSEISSGIDFDRNSFNQLLDDVLNHKIQNIYVSHKDRLTRLSFKTIESIFLKFNTKIIIINDTHNNSNDNEIFEELINLMNIFSTTMYSNRRKNKINIYKQDIENFISEN